MARPRNGAGHHYAHVVGWGVAVPEQVMTNADIERLVETNDKWIRDRTGIAERRIADERDTAATLGARAARKALYNADILPRDVDLIVVATSSPEYFFPSTASLIQDRIGATRAAGFDLLAACTGFIYALDMATAKIKCGQIETAIVIGTEVMSRVLDWSDRSTCILFGDGAGAFVLKANDMPGGVMETVLHSDGSGSNLLTVGTGMRPVWNGQHGPQHVEMNGREVFRFATRVMASATEEVVELAGCSMGDVDLIVPHQANLRIIQAAARSLRMQPEQFVVNLDRYGNTSAASIPIAVAEAAEEGRIRPNQTIVLVGFGAGLTWGATLIEWAVKPTPATAIRDVVREGQIIFGAIQSFWRRVFRYIGSALFRPPARLYGETFRRWTKRQNTKRKDGSQEDEQ
ncbi:MAG: ketoacyl-ACP synthase III [Chloroflexi bacterium]|nr:ketoacyl-ACP synthase III [Chloroflexota bacterium]